MKKLRFGFTMIELLIVIAILGILAVAVLSAINPLEQIRRGRDTGSRSDAEQMINAVERYYASKGYMPWQTAESDTTAFTWAASAPTADAQWVDTLSKLVESDEIKSGFTARVMKTTANPIYLFYDGTSTSNSVYACFVPQSKSMKQDSAIECQTRTDQADFTAGSACPNQCDSGTWNGTDNCHLCLP